MADIPSPEELVGREVSFFWNRCHHKRVSLRGTVIQPARIAGAVIIEEKPGALYSRPISEIELLEVN